MKRQEGFALPTWAIYALAAAAALGALWWAYDTVDGRGYARGKSEVEANYAERDNKALKDALDRVQVLQAEIRAREASHQAAVASLSEKHQQEKAHAKRQHDRDLAAVRAGTLKLRDPGATATAAQCDRSPERPPAATAGGDHAATGSELSGAASEFLLSLMHEADGVVRQLTAAQGLIREQVKTCNGLPTPQK